MYLRPSISNATAPFLTSRFSSVLIVRGFQFLSEATRWTTSPADNGPPSQTAFITSHSESEICGIFAIALPNDYNCSARTTTSVITRQAQNRKLAGKGFSGGLNQRERLGNVRGCGFGGERAAEQVSLPVVAVHCLEERHLLGRFKPLGDHLHVQVVGEAHDRVDHRRRVAPLGEVV